MGQFKKIAPWILALLAIGACAATLWPFAQMLAWGALIAVACEPAVSATERIVGGRGRAALAVSAALAIAVGLPLGLALASAAGQASLAVDALRRFFEGGWAPAPAWLAALPWVGSWASGAWSAMASSGLASALSWGKDHAGQAAGLAAAGAGVAAASAGAALASLAAATLLMAHGKSLAAQIDAAGARWVGADAGEWTALMVAAIRGVAVGVCGTALALSVLVACGLQVAGIPAISLLFCISMALCLAQIGPLPILVPVAGYLFIQGSFGAAMGMVVLALALSVIDGVMRPYLIGRHVKMPMLLILAGVVGGLLAFGLIGLFIGPCALAVGSKIWSKAMRSTEAAKSASSG